MLGLTTHEPLPALELTRPSRQVRPALALLLSLLCPGLGHLYVGLFSRAAWIFFSELLCLCLLAAQGPLQRAAVFSIPAIYCFAMIDAYFGAREWNAGATSLLEGTNPRIVAILNLLTKGFGYFYLGDRTKGLLCFFIISIVQGLLQNRPNVWSVILGISLQVAIAIDGYRFARQSLHRAHPDLGQNTTIDDNGNSVGLIDRANPGGLKPAIATVLFVLIGLSLCLAYVALRAINGHAVKSRGTLEQGPSGLTYRDTQERYSVVLPDGWSPLNPDTSQALFAGDSGSLLIHEQYAFYPVSTLLDATEKEVRVQNPDLERAPCTATIGQRRAACMEIEYATKKMTHINQRFIAIRRGMKIFVLIESWPAGERPPVMDGIEQNLRLN
jgi:hypothetical protein